MPDETSQPTTSPEPAQTPVEAKSAPIVAPEPAQSPTEPIPASTVDSTASNVPPDAPESPTSTVIPPSGQISVSAPEPQNPPSSPASTPAEPSPTSAPAPQPVVVIQQANPRSFLAKALEKIQFRKRAKLERIVKLALEKKAITNDQVEKLLHVSDATASRYLLQLVKDGKFKRVGPAGRARYEPASGSLPTN